MMKAPKQQPAVAGKTDKRQPFLQRKPSNTGAADRPFVSPQHSPVIQPKLTVNKPGDAYEQEADRMAEQVMRMPVENAAPPMISRMHAGGAVQRMCSACAQSGSTCSDCAESNKVPEIQRKPENSDPTHTSEAVTQRLVQRKGRGNTLPPAVQEQMAQAFQSDFSNVRLHTDPEAAAMSRDLNAQAFTYGQDIYFNAGKYEPGTAAGRGLLGHELTHTVQQGGGGIKRQKSVVESLLEESKKNISQAVLSVVEKGKSYVKERILEKELEQNKPESIGFFKFLFRNKMREFKEIDSNNQGLIANRNKYIEEEIFRINFWLEKNKNLTDEEMANLEHNSH